MTSTIEQAARVIEPMLERFGSPTEFAEPEATAIAQALSDAGMLAGGDREVTYEVVQGDDFCASADSLSDAKHYAAVYGQDGPVEIIEVTSFRRPFPAAPQPALADDGLLVGEGER